MDFGVVEALRKLHRARPDRAGRFALQNIWKRRSAAGIQIVGRPHEEVQVAVEEPVWVSAVSTVTFSVRPKYIP